MDEATMGNPVDHSIYSSSMIDGVMTRVLNVGIVIDFDTSVRQYREMIDPNGNVHFLVKIEEGEVELTEENQEMVSDQVEPLMNYLLQIDPSMNLLICVESVTTEEQKKTYAALRQNMEESGTYKEYKDSEGNKMTEYLFHFFLTKRMVGGLYIGTSSLILTLCAECFTHTMVVESLRNRVNVAIEKIKDQIRSN